MPDDAAPVATEEMTPEQLRAQPYKFDDVDQLHEKGVINLRPHGDRLLLRAIRRQDAFSIAQTTIDARDCNCHEVLAVGAGCAAWYEKNGIPEEARVKVGQHVFIVAAATDRASKVDRGVRIWGARAEHVIFNWDAPKA